MQLTTEGKINGLINLHGRTKAVMKNEVLESGGEQIKADREGKHMKILSLAPEVI